MRIAKMHLLSLSALALAACGSTSDPTYSDLLDEFSTIDAQFDRSDTSQMSDPATLPVLGSFVYNGVLGVNFGPDDARNSLIGDMRLVADFDASGISGDVNNFIDVNDVTYSGQLDITGGNINRAADLATQYTYGADLDGQLTDEDGGQYSFDMTLRGDFFGDNQEFVGGDLAGDVITPDGTVTYDGDSTYFVGER